MAHKFTDGGPAGLCADQQGLDSGGAGLYPQTHRIAPPEAAAVAGNSNRTAAAGRSQSPFREVMKSRILVIEDNEANRELLGDWLESEGFEVVYAENLAQSCAAFDTNLPHAVLLDVQLGREDGLFFAKWMRQRQSLRDIPILAVTAHAMTTD